jgi:hypothetical protein
MNTSDPSNLSLLIMLTDPIAVMNVFSSPLVSPIGTPRTPIRHEMEDEEPEVISTIKPTNHAPLTASKLDMVISNEMDEPVQSESTLESTFYVERPKLKDLLTATPIRQQRRSIDIPSSLERFKSLKLGMSTDAIGNESRRASIIPELSEDNETKKTITKTGSKSPFLLGSATDLMLPSTVSKNCDAFVFEQPAVLKEPILKFEIPEKSSFALAKKEAAEPFDKFQKAELQSMLNDLRSTLRNDIQAIHIEIIRQSLASQNQMRQCLDERLPMVKDLMEELKRLREENERLRLLLKYQ